MRSVHTAPCLLKLSTFAPHSHFSLTLQGELLTKPERLLTNKQEFSLSILSVSITLACLLGSSFFCTCFVPWALRRLDGQSMEWALVPPHIGLSISMFFVLPPFLTILSSLPVSFFSQLFSQWLILSWLKTAWAPKESRKTKRERRRVRDCNCFHIAFSMKHDALVP